MGEILYLLLPAAAVVLLIVIISTGYVKAPPDTAYIISGFRKPRILIGKAGVRIPFLERMDKLSLKMFSVDVKTTDFVPNSEYINVKVDATVKIRVGQAEDMMSLAARFFLNEDEKMIIGRVQDTLEGNMREIIGQMKLSEMVTDRKAFGERVQENAIPDLQKMGLELVSFNVQSFSDQNGVIDDLGIDNISQIKKSAAIAKAQADRDVAIEQAKANKEANDAKVESEMQIAQKQTELAIRESELKKQADIKQAEADAAYRIQEQEQQKTIETSTVNAQIAKTEREAELKNKEVEVAKQTLDAEIRAKADAERYRLEQQAQAELFKRQKEAEARRYEQEQEAEATKKAAEAEKFAREQEAAGIAAVGKAQAQAIQAKALAEAEGIDKKAEAMKKYGEAAIVEMIMTALPEIAKNVAQPLSKVDKITMYGEGNSAKLISDIVNGTTQVTEGIAQGMGLDIKALIAGLIGGKLASHDTVIVDTGKCDAAECEHPGADERDESFFDPTPVG
ncbi:flotillin family protein [Feifania hominis]|uniref:Flotillin family protein n=1 Tax=Feifania hominis TaxID=2763660 RepID=A0A926DDK9_9FIRM|nr:flotillin family protein [Feifania hominis]MBC8536143.1 flotillin family protein [Feifania hominis]